MCVCLYMCIKIHMCSFSSSLSWSFYPLKTLEAIKTQLQSLSYFCCKDNKSSLMPKGWAFAFPLPFLLWSESFSVLIALFSLVKLSRVRILSLSLHPFCWYFSALHSIIWLRLIIINFLPSSSLKKLESERHLIHIYFCITWMNANSGS